VAREKEKMDSVREILLELKYESTLLEMEGESFGGTGGLLELELDLEYSSEVVLRYLWRSVSLEAAMSTIGRPPWASMPDFGGSAQYQYQYRYQYEYRSE
jgi:hypothetical protein